MLYRVYNYTAFYVSEPFSPYNLGSYATKDFCYYQLLKKWKSEDITFPFMDAHKTTYSVRDSSDWDKTLKPRLHERLNNSKNIILFLSSYTKQSRALREEIDYGINQLLLPVIVIYPEYKNLDQIAQNKKITSNIEALWNNLPVFKNSMTKIPSLHIPLYKSYISQGLKFSEFTIQRKITPDTYFLI